MKALISGLVGGLSAIIVNNIIKKLNLKKKYQNDEKQLNFIRSILIGVLTFIILIIVFSISDL